MPSLMPSKRHSSRSLVPRFGLSFRRLCKFFLPDDSPPDSYLRSRVNIYTGTPDLRELDWVNWMPNGAHVAFSPVSPVRGEDARKQFDLCQRICAKYGFDILSTFCVGWREMHHIAMLIFDKGDPESKANALACLRELISEAAKMGYGEYRTHLILQDQVAATYNWNNNVSFEMYMVNI